MNCPRCNAGTSRKAGVWICGTSSNTHGGGVTESLDCLRNQLAQKDAEIERLQAKLMELRYGMFFPPEAADAE